MHLLRVHYDRHQGSTMLPRVRPALGSWRRDHNLEEVGALAILTRFINLPALPREYPRLRQGREVP